MSQRFFLALFITSVFFFACSEKQSFESLYNPDESDYYVADEISGHLHKPFAKREF